MIAEFYPHVRTVFEIGGESSKYIRLDEREHPRLRPLRRVRGRHRIVPRPAGAAHAVLGGRSGRPGGARRLRRAHRRPLLGVRQERHDPRPAEGLCAGRDSARPVRRGGAQFQEHHRQGPAGGSAGGADRRGFAKRRRHRGAARGLRAAPRASCSCPEQYAWCGAIGAAMLEAEEPRKRSIAAKFTACASTTPKSASQDTTPLSTENVVQLRDRVGVYVAAARRPTRFRRIWASISARFPPTWWPSTNPAR